MAVKPVQGPKPWEVTYKVKVDGKWKGRSKRFKYKRDADEFDREWKQANAKGTAVDPVRARITLGEYVEQHWWPTKGVGATSRQTMEGHLKNYILPAFGKKPLNSIGVEEVSAWMKSLSHRANNTQVGIIGTLANILQLAEDAERITRNPFNSAMVKKQRPKPKKSVRIPWTPEQVDGIVEALPERYRILGLICEAIGLRQGEAFGVAVEDFDFLRGTFSLNRQVLMVDSKRRFGPPKYDKLRELPVPTRLLEALAAYMQAYPPKEVTLPWSDEKGVSDIPDGEPTTVRLIVTTRESGAICRNDFNDRVWKPALASVGIVPTRLTGMHNMRHTWASQLLDDGVNPNSISQWAGHHATSFTIDYYTHELASDPDTTRKELDAAYERRRKAAEQAKRTGTDMP